MEAKQLIVWKAFLVLGKNTRRKASLPAPFVGIMVPREILPRTVRYGFSLSLTQNQPT